MTIHQILNYYWKHTQFRPLQEEIINSVLEGNDTLALLPTGGGKSVCFQIPAIYKSGICIVVSPLIALMKDQVENLKARGIESVAIFSGMGKREIDILLDNCIYGQIKFLYLSPERLLSDLVRERIRYMKVNLIAVDEAHCISQWGYDFRPPYLHIAELREIHPDVPVLALTATATRRVAEDIQQKLKFKKENIFRGSFERQNLIYVVNNDENKLRRLFSIAKKVRGSGIVYVRNRRETQEIARLLQREGMSADFYHAGLDTQQRSVRQGNWKKNKTRIMVATNAFGMGIDKPDVRFVVHMDLPESLEAYYQEAGRAGRDDKKAYAVILYHQSDKLRLQKKIESSTPSLEDIKTTYHNLGNFFQIAYDAGQDLTFEFDVAEFAARFKTDVVKTLNVLKYLERDEYISVTESVYLPSRLRIGASPQDLYKFQIEHAAYDVFIKTLLRSYGGLYEQYVLIRETDLARMNGISAGQVVEIIRKLEGLQLLSYLPQTDKPRLTFIKSRVDSNDLLIDLNYLKERQKILTEQINAVIDYTEKNICRNIQLLNYFDELNPQKCRICDVCLQEKRRLRGEFQTEEITDTVLNLLAEKHLTLDELVKNIHLGNEKEKIDMIRELLDAGKIKTNGTNYYL